MENRISEEEALAWQEEFPLLQRKIHVANCSQGPQAKRVRNAIHRYLDNWLEKGMAWSDWLAEVQEAKNEFARLIRAEPEEIAISTSASEAASSIASAFIPAGGKNRIVTTEAEFPTLAHVWMAQRKMGFKVAFVPVRNGKIYLEDYEPHIDEKTILTSVTHVYYQNGFKQDLKEIAQIAHRKGSLILVDAYQSLGTCRVDVKELDIDILISGTLKFLLGVPGIAFLYIRKTLAGQLEPAVTGWFGQQQPFAFNSQAFEYAEGARRFETGTPPLVNAYAARAGMQLVREVGDERIERRIYELSEYAMQLARDLGLHYAGPENFLEKGSTTAIQVPDPEKLEMALMEKNIIASARGNMIRIAPHFFTTRQDIQRVLLQIKELTRLQAG